MTKQPTVLVTGGAGYVGSHACKALHRAGILPVTLDNLSTGHQQAVKWGPLEVGDVRNESLVTQLQCGPKSTPRFQIAPATRVGVRLATRLVTDGPFAETREQLGGYFLIDAKDLDEAMAIAARIPMARLGTVEIRPVIEIAGLPTK